MPHARLWFLALILLVITLVLLARSTPEDPKQVVICLPGFATRGGSTAKYLPKL
jgi:hypothetical protein